MTPSEFHENRKTIQTNFGEISYIEAGEGPAVLFIHGFPLNGYHWRDALERFKNSRHCLAPDLMGLGYTTPNSDVSLDFPTQADMLFDFLDHKNIDRVDLVSNDSGTAIAQLMAVKHPERVRSLCLTNGDVHDNYPPPSFSTIHDLAEQGQLGATLEALAANLEMTQQAFSLAFQYPERLSEELMQVYLAPLVENEDKKSLATRYVTAMDNRQMQAIEPCLKRLKTPTLVVWADNDAYFSEAWGKWLANTLPNAQLQPVKGGKLFFTEERSDEFLPMLAEHWQAIE